MHSLLRSRSSGSCREGDKVKTIELHVHSFSLRYHLRYREQTDYDVFAYIDEMARLGNAVPSLIASMRLSSARITRRY